MDIHPLHITAGVVSSVPYELDDATRNSLTPNALSAIEKSLSELLISRITYRADGRLITGYIIEPKSTGPFPAVIACRGGFQDFGKITIRQMTFGIYGQIAKAGYVVFISQYSGTDGSEGVDQYGGSDVEDVAALLPIARAYERVDSSKIGMYAGSRGATMLFQLLARPDTKVKAAVSLGSLVDFEATAKLRPRMADVFLRAFGGSAEEMVKRSVSHWPEKIDPETPLLLMHGTSDNRAPVVSVIDLAKRLIELKRVVRLILYEGADHYVSEQRSSMEKQTISWLDRFLKNNEPLPNTELHGE